MANILDIKPLIRNFIVDNVHRSLKDNVYWLGERYEIPTSPYIVLSVIAENKDKRTSTHSGSRNYDSRAKIFTIYKTATITISIYNNAIGGNYDIAKEFSYQQINLIEQLFETKDVNNIYSINRISPIRPLHEVADGGYLFRFEFDLTIGYNETVMVEKPIGMAAQVEVFTNKCKKDGIGFIVELDNEDICVETEVENNNCNCNL